MSLYLTVIPWIGHLTTQATEAKTDKREHAKSQAWGAQEMKNTANKWPVRPEGNKHPEASTPKSHCSTARPERAERIQRRPASGCSHSESLPIRGLKATEVQHLTPARRATSGPGEEVSSQEQLTALAEDHSLVPGTHIWLLTPTCGSSSPVSNLFRHLCLFRHLYAYLPLHK